ncbi:ParB/RepB/Spo0J family partition protein [Chachezhania sediminis]|uniref:ParB/RepB/Spo0J family partition protein n=1 Tax=Chachezhania sediminis TaxID=2599291 RepID=UPI00131E6DA1|nr:ParB N-terminal domain-containing protein [Chachezhania sediminis]
MSKRRIFDINFPGEEPAAETPPVEEAPVAPEPAGRRGPMATAISENAEALRSRQAAEAAIRAENDRLAHEHVRLKKAGLIVDLVPLGAIRTEKLARDRSQARDPELDELKESIRAIGLSNPIRVEHVGEGAYELVQGFRRLSAYQELFAETGDERYAAIPAGLIASGEALEALYRRMVDENLVRRDISFAEMAELARAYASDPMTEAGTVEESVAVLYASAGRQKRAYIRHFADLLDTVGDALDFPEAIPRALGLDLQKRLAERPELAADLRESLEAVVVSEPGAELSALRNWLSASDRAARAERPARTEDAKAKTTLRCTVPAGTVRCAARNGRVELAMERDFSVVERHRLEAAIAAFFEALDR